MLVDTHCHLNFKAFKGKVDEVINEAKKAGIGKIIIPGAKLDSSQKAVVLAEKYDGVYAAVGIHPYHAVEISKLSDCELRIELEKLVKNKKVVAIGECGLDYHQVKSHKLRKKVQKKIFGMQIELAKKLKLPLIIHNRQTSEDILETINHFEAVFHCFQGNFNLLNWAIKNNFYVGITGIVTYDKKMQEVVKKTPLKNLLIETDSPFLVPEPLRSQKVFPNTPKNVKIVAQWTAKLKNKSFAEVAKITTQNAARLFRFKRS